MTEIEAKFFLGGETIARRLARQCGLVWKDGEFEINRVFDFGDERLKKKGALVRLRTRGERAWMTFKAKTPSELRHTKVRVEHETELLNPDAAAAALEGIGLAEVLRYERYRAGYNRGDARIDFDLLPGGWFCEIEGDPGAIDATIRQGGLVSAMPITLSYPEIFVRLRELNRVESGAWTFNLLKESEFRIPPPGHSWWGVETNSR